MLLYYITDRTQFSVDERSRRELLLHKIDDAARAAVDYIQLREKDLSSCQLEELARAAVHRTAGTRSRLLINSRTDIALASGAHGVHLRSKDISPEDVRKVWQGAEPGRIPVVGLSCHTEQEVIAAKKAAADFFVFGPVFEKLGQPGAGLALLRSACRHNIPVLALGGVTLENAHSCIQAGAAGIASIRLFQENEVKNVVERLRE